MPAVTAGVRVSTRLWILFGLGLVGAVWALSHAPKAHAQEFVPGEAAADAVAGGGDGGSARGGDGGRGGSGVFAACSSNTNDAAGFAADVDCAAGGAGGDGGNGGESRGGNGGIAFTIGGLRPPEEPEHEPEQLADLAVTNTGAASVHSCVQGCSTTQTVTVRNVGQATAAAATLTDSIASGGAVIVNAVANGAPCAVNGVPSPNVTIHCTLGDLAPGASAVITVELSFTLGSADELSTSTATASTPSPEASLANNQAALAVTLFVV